MRLLLGSAVALGTLMAASAQARSPAELSCIEKMFDDKSAIAMAQLGSTDQQTSDDAMKSINFFMLGMQSRMCAKRGGWSENEYGNSIGYMMAWPTMRGLQLLHAKDGYTAMDRAYAARATVFAKEAKLTDAQADSVVEAAKADGLVVGADADAVHDARRYADVIHQLTMMRADFAANRKPASLRK